MSDKCNHIMLAMKTRSLDDREIMVGHSGIMCPCWRQDMGENEYMHLARSMAFPIGHTHVSYSEEPCVQCNSYYVSSYHCDLCGKTTHGN
jgi:hypothetical protein